MCISWSGSFSQYWILPLSSWYKLKLGSYIGDHSENLSGEWRLLDFCRQSLGALPLWGMTENEHPLPLWWLIESYIYIIFLITLLCVFVFIWAISVNIWQNMGASSEDWQNLGTPFNNWQNLGAPPPLPIRGMTKSGHSPLKSLQPSHRNVSERSLGIIQDSNRSGESVFGTYTTREKIIAYGLIFWKIWFHLPHLCTRICSRYAESSRGRTLILDRPVSTAPEPKWAKHTTSNIYDHIVAIFFSFFKI